MKVIIDLPEIVLTQLAKLAEKENRSRKNFIESELIKIVEAKKKKIISSMSKS